MDKCSFGSFKFRKTKFHLEFRIMNFQKNENKNKFEITILFLEHRVKFYFGLKKLIGIFRRKKITEIWQCGVLIKKIVLLNSVLNKYWLEKILSESISKQAGSANSSHNTISLLNMLFSKEMRRNYFTTSRK